jgi:hypothetical protein
MDLINQAGLSRCLMVLGQLSYTRDRKVIAGKPSIDVGAHFLRDIETGDFMPGLDGRMAKILEVR